MFSYTVPGAPEASAYGMVTDRFVLVVDSAAGIGTAMELWDALVAEGAVLEDALMIAARHGMRRVPDFAIVELVDAATGSVTIAVRGRGRAQLGSSPDRYYSGKGAGTWIEASAQNISEMTVGLRSDTEGELRLPLGRGVVRTDQVHWGVPLPTPASYAEVHESDVPSWAEGITVGGDATPVQTTTALDLSDEETVLGSLRRRRSDEPDVLEETILGARRPAPTRSASFALVFDSGRVIRLETTPVVVGRAPLAEPGSGVRVESLPSPAKEVSSTHAELRVTSGVLLVTDLRSTNGTVITARGEDPFVLRDGASAHLSPGDRVDFGDGNAAVFAPAPTA